VAGILRQALPMIRTRVSRPHILSDFMRLTAACTFSIAIICAATAGRWFAGFRRGFGGFAAESASA